jgi:hypothetical protein
MLSWRPLVSAYHQDRDFLRFVSSSSRAATETPNAFASFTRVRTEGLREPRSTSAR